MDENPTRICELVVGLGEVEVLGVDDAPGGPLGVGHTPLDADTADLQLSMSERSSVDNASRLSAISLGGAAGASVEPVVVDGGGGSSAGPHAATSERTGAATTRNRRLSRTVMT